MKIKALFLLLTFLLNSAIGLCCALQTVDDCCEEVAAHQPDLSINNRQDRLSLIVAAPKDACCQDAVNNFTSLDKLVPQPLKVLIPVSVAVVRSAYVYSLIVVPVVQTAHQPLIDERQWPPTPDIRTIIQSFQV